MCPAYRLALKLIQSTLANLLHGFDWKLPANVKPEDVDMEVEYGLRIERSQLLPSLSLDFVLTSISVPGGLVAVLQSMVAMDAGTVWVEIKIVQGQNPTSKGCRSHEDESIERDTAKFGGRNNDLFGRADVCGRARLLRKIACLLCFTCRMAKNPEDLHVPFYFRVAKNPEDLRVLFYFRMAKNPEDLCVPFYFRMAKNPEDLRVPFYFKTVARFES
ncbi:hypothetical protein Vadar_031420 [Vaccinium darrowii]|uniref:Uncharacterized protein n=1 Tax=Vaccinium darrowii TaxID=229202 RepID=A0ACB7X5I1_9ERIC|nr:hypothetical protein Vadar_031420 [Vaccinium darrowii]